MRTIMEVLAKYQEKIDAFNINIVNIIFVFLTVMIVFLGSLINFLESRLPKFVSQSFRYGKFSYRGVGDPLVSKLEMPKSYFRHFYDFAFAFASLAFALVLKALILNATASNWVLAFLDFVAGGRGRRVQIDFTCGFLSIVLLTLQCARRFYETNFVQIFSRGSKINISHYLVGYLHYFGAIVALLGSMEGFVRGSVPTSFSLSRLSLVQYLCMFIFHFSWSQQYKANVILVNLRKDALTGRVITDGHLLPRGGFFELISSPHMFFEMAMYLALLGLVPHCTMWYFVCMWVVCNQICTATLTHRWYQENFKNYPKNRWAVLPFIL